MDTLNTGNYGTLNTNPNNYVQTSPNEKFAKPIQSQPNIQTKETKERQTSGNSGGLM